MGVPGVYAWVRDKLKRGRLEVKSLGDHKVHKFYLDANCLFHPQCFKLLAHMEKNKKPLKTEELEELMIERIINYIIYLIIYVGPEVLFIAVDGVAPAAKMAQQRARRFKSIYDENERNRLYKKHKKKIYNKWTNSVITPGTPFMERLHQRLLRFVKEFEEIPIEYSSYHVAGEGEHKIMNDIRDNGSTDENYVIYGLDADLLFLSLAASKYSIHLLRESILLGKKKRTDVKEHHDPVEDVTEEMNFVSIDYLRESLSKIAKNALISDDMSDADKSKINDISDIRICNDLIVACYFLGNDFLPHIASVDVHSGGIDIIIKAYANAIRLTNSHLVEVTDDSISFNDIVMEEFLKYMAVREDYFFRELLPKKRLMNEKKSAPKDMDPLSRALWDIENMKFPVDDPIKLGIGSPEQWKYRYYDHHTKTSTYQSDMISILCDMFFEGIVWTSMYYFHGCQSWSWKYESHHAPFISDLYRYARDALTLNDIEFECKGHLLPLQQLLAVLPPQRENILPFSYRHLMTDINSPIIEYYPVEYDIDMIDIGISWKTHPLIPFVDLDNIRRATKSIKLSDDEKVRNRVDRA